MSESTIFKLIMTVVILAISGLFSAFIYTQLSGGGYGSARGIVAIIPIVLAVGSLLSAWFLNS